MKKSLIKLRIRYSKKEEYMEKRAKLTYEESHKVQNDILYKLCTICEKWYPMNETYFYKNKSSKQDGFNTWCVECSREKSRKYKNEHREHLNKLNRKLYKIKRKEYLIEKQQYYKDNKEYILNYAKQWRQNNPSKISEYIKIREQNKKHTISTKEWKSCKEYFSNCCAYCGLPIEKHYIKVKGEIKLGDFHREHVDHNGSNDLSNRILSCKGCNSEKHKFKLEEWYNKENSKFNKERLNKIHKWLNEDYKKYIKVKK